MLLQCDQMSANARYHVFTQTVVPRPIAWILTQSADQSLNLAPFSYFNVICSEPALAMVSVGHKPNGEEKDTRVNLRRHGFAVVHIPSREQAQAVTETAASLPAQHSEISAVGLALTEFSDFCLPRLREARVAMACSLYEYREVGAQRQALITLNIEQVYIDPACARLDDSGRIAVDAALLDPLCRLGGGEYAGLGDIFSQRRPR